MKCLGILLCGCTLLASLAACGREQQQPIVNVYPQIYNIERPKPLPKEPTLLELAFMYIPKLLEVYNFLRGDPLQIAQVRYYTAQAAHYENNLKLFAATEQTKEDKRRGEDDK